MNIHDLYAMPASYKFSDEELAFIKKYVSKKRKSFVCKYAFYKGVSKRSCQIAFIIDQTDNAVRRSGVENKWEIICTRPISNIEFEELCQNFGCHRQRFIVWYYNDINYLINEDLKYDVTTPQKFVDRCIEKGYIKNYQTKLSF